MEFYSPTKNMIGYRFTLAIVSFRRLWPMREREDARIACKQWLQDLKDIRDFKF